MNWTKFQTYDMSPEKAFEILCNQLFENWCKEEYFSEIHHFNVVNGSGGDGGVESFAELNNGSIIGLQAKWFHQSIQSSQIAQIKNSIGTALTIYPTISRYIVCVPRDLASRTSKSKNTERGRWEGLVSFFSDEHPEITIELWDETRITSELQKETSVGIFKFWFQNSEVSRSNILNQFNKSKNSWLITKYEPSLNAFGEIDSILSMYLGKIGQRRNLFENISNISNLCEKCLIESKELMKLCLESDENLYEILKGLQDKIAKLSKQCEDIRSSIAVEPEKSLEVDFGSFYVDFDSIIERIRRSDSYHKIYFHTSDLLKQLLKLSKINYFELTKKIRLILNRHAIIIKGDPGTGKTHGVSAFSEQLFSEDFHLPILIQARDIPSEDGWKDIIEKNLGLSGIWNEDEIWQGLTAMVNRNRFSEKSIDENIKILPKVLIIIDGIDESSTVEKWIERINETETITCKYPNIRFCFTMRPFIDVSNIKYAKTFEVGNDGDVPVAKLFDKYIKEYNINVKHQSWLKHTLTTPLSLKLFCELYRNKSFDSNDNAEVCITELWRKKISKIEEEFCSKVGRDMENQYIFKSVVLLSKFFLKEDKIERNSIIELLKNELDITRNISEELIKFMVDYGILSCYCEHGTGIEPNIYLYSQGMQGYYDYASAMHLLNDYDHPDQIDFNGKSIQLNTFYSLTIISIQKYDYLITKNDTLKSVLNEYSINELYFLTLQNTNHNNAVQFVDELKDKMNISADRLITIVNELVLPLSRDLAHPLGVGLLDSFLKDFNTPAQRDILWSNPGFLRGSYNKKWYQSYALKLDDEQYRLSEDDTYQGLPTVYAWTLSSVNNSFRKNSRNELMRWALSTPREFYKLFLSFSNVNDPQIISDLFAVLMCLVFESDDFDFIREISSWIMTNILDPSLIERNRDIAIRYYSVAVIRKSIQLDIFKEEEVRIYLPPYQIDELDIKLNKEALKGTRMGGYSAINYDLARYVLIDHFSSRFNVNDHKGTNQFSKLIEEIGLKYPGFSNISFEQFIISAAYAFVLDMGWNEKEFYNYDKDSSEKEIIGGIDCSIRETYIPATHGSMSNVMTVCEKYVWQARNYISGFLCDRLLFGDKKIKVEDYGILNDFIIPLQDMDQFNPNDIPEDIPWIIPEEEKVILNKHNENKIDVIKGVIEAPEIDWGKWISFTNEGLGFRINTNSLIALEAYSCFTGLAGIETNLSVNCILLDKNDLHSFKERLKNEEELVKKISTPSDWYGGIESSCYITPKEVCWFPWKERYDSYNVGYFPEINITSAVDRCCYNYLDYGDVYYSLPSVLIRDILGINDSNGYVFLNKHKDVVAEFRINGENWKTYQQYLVVDKEELFNKIEEIDKALVWIISDYRRESGKAKERFGDFYAQKIINYIGYFDSGKFVTEQIDSEMSSSECLQHE